MNSYQALIDPTNFGVVANYLRNPKSEIDYVLHVKDRDTLCRLAEELQRPAERPGDTSRQRSALVTELLRERMLLISSRKPLAGMPLSCIIDPSSIPVSAPCEVLYLPPYYLAHTPGLFEGTLLRASLSPRQQPRFPQPHEMRIKP